MSKLFCYRIRELQKKTEGILIKEKLPLDVLRDFLPSLEFDIEHCTVELDAHLVMHQRDYIGCKGIIQCTLSANCHRCLEPALFLLDIPIQVLFLPQWEQDDSLPKQPKDLEIDDTSGDESVVDVSFHDGEWVDLVPYLKEQILLMLPLQIFCKEDCLGICQKCGTNRNEKACECEQTELHSFSFRLGGAS